MNKHMFAEPELHQQHLFHINSSLGNNEQVLHMIMGLERLDRITAFTEEASRVPESPFQTEAAQSAFPPRPKASSPSPENGKKVPPPLPPGMLQIANSQHS